MRLVLTFILLFASAAWAVEPDEVLDDPVLEQRARDISANIRCVVCQNEPIDSSNAGVARDLRILIRERLAAGDSNQEVEAYLVARYGDYVLFKPPLKPSTYLLWYGPFVILLFGIGGVVLAMRANRLPSSSLTAEEESKVDEILSKMDDER